MVEAFLLPLHVKLAGTSVRSEIQYRRTGRDARIHVKAVACVVVHVPYIRSIDRDPPEIDRRWRRRPIDRHRIRG